MAKKHIIYALCAIIASLVILSMVYTVIDKETDVSPIAEKTSVQIREIETPGKKWLNGYLGIFFRFKFLGNINWLIIKKIVKY